MMMTFTVRAAVSLPCSKTVVKLNQTLIDLTNIDDDEQTMMTKKAGGSGGSV